MDNILQLLRLGSFEGLTENIEIAKGKNKLPESFKEGIKQTKRAIKWQRK